MRGEVLTLLEGGMARANCFDKLLEPQELSVESNCDMRQDPGMT